MLAIVLLSLRDMKHRWVLSFFMALLFSVTFASYVSLVTYQSSVSKMYPSLETSWLVVDMGLGSGEFHGSRLSSEVGELLESYGYEPIPEINQAVGTSTANAILLRGIKPEHLYTVDPFNLVSGKALQPDDPPRMAMVGTNLAERKNIGLGDMISLRGRDFSVIGIFETGSYQDNQAWISLEDAQVLLDYGSDVSIYYIPDGDTLRAGASPEKGMLIFQHGESGRSYRKDIMGYYRYLGLIGVFLGLATLITLTNTLWRLAWLHRRQFGMVRALGFGRRSVVIYLLTQAGPILLFGILLGSYFAVAVMNSQITTASHFGVSLTPSWDLNTLTIIILLTALFAGAGVFLPAFRINRMKIPDLLGKE